MYDKERETDAKAAKAHNDNLKKNAAERLARNAAWCRANKK